MARASQEWGGAMYDVITYEKQYSDQADSLVTVAFLLRGCDWNLLRNSDSWNGVEDFLLMRQREAEGRNRKIEAE